MGATNLFFDFSPALRRAAAGSPSRSWVLRASVRAAQARPQDAGGGGWSRQRPGEVPGDAEQASAFGCPWPLPWAWSLFSSGRFSANVLLGAARTTHGLTEKPPGLASGAKSAAHAQRQEERRVVAPVCHHRHHPLLAAAALPPPSRPWARDPVPAPRLWLSACPASWPPRPQTPILPIASSCCTEVSRHISRRLLERVNICRIQRADGDCDLAAVILHIRRRRVCVSPHSHIIKQWMKEQEAKKKAKGNLCHKKKQDGKRNSKGAHQGKPETHGYKTPY
ncbi:C-C motif chemokine 28 [Herpailurus yagouaroundi]|uniref:C-C motif chemokine 28 n=1 Tax=Herpailurus yagouaroundi TaxID=1608482 RepID=UPI001AD6B4ED|nr:C-C motif chemokine 28 [Puma yagouaroundi]